VRESPRHVQPLGGESAQSGDVARSHAQLGEKGVDVARLEKATRPAFDDLRRQPIRPGRKDRSGLR